MLMFKFKFIMDSSSIQNATAIYQFIDLHLKRPQDDELNILYIIFFILFTFTFRIYLRSDLNTHEYYSEKLKFSLSTHSSTQVVGLK